VDRDDGRKATFLVATLLTHLGRPTYAVEEIRKSDLTAHGFRSTFRDWAPNEPWSQRCLAENGQGEVVEGYLPTDIRISNPQSEFARL
jgi:hypothetical protein